MTSVAVIGSFPPLKGGVSQHTAQLADAFERAGASTDRIGWAAQYPGFAYGRDQIDQTAPVIPDVDRLLKWWDPTSWIRAGRRAARCEVAHWGYVTPVHALPQTVMLARSSAAVRVLHVHNVEPHERFPLWRPAISAVLRQVDLVVCHAESLADQLVDLGFDRARIVVLAHPPDLQVRQCPLPAGPPKLLFAGTIRPYKGLDLLLESLAACATELPDGTSLTVAGEVWDDSQVAGLRRAAESVELEVDLRLSYQSDAALVELLASHHMLVAPYRSATQSGIVSLALAAGRPVVATNVGGLPDAVHEGVNGALSDPDSDAFAAAMLRALANLDQLAEGALSTTVSWDDYVAAILEASADVKR